MTREALQERQAHTIRLSHSPEMNSSANEYGMRTDDSYEYKGFRLVPTDPLFGCDGSALTLTHPDKDGEEIQSMVVEKDQTGNVSATWDTEISVGTFLQGTEAYFSHYNNVLPQDEPIGTVEVTQLYEFPLHGVFQRPLVEDTFLQDGKSLFTDQDNPFRLLQVKSSVGTLMYSQDGAVGLQANINFGNKLNNILAAMDFIHATRDDIPERVLYQALK